jgi:hypothetical protein
VSLLSSFYCLLSLLDPLQWRYDRIPLSDHAWGSAIYLTEEYLYFWGTLPNNQHVTTLARIGVDRVRAGTWEATEAFVRDVHGVGQYITMSLSMRSRGGGGSYNFFLV